MIGPATAQDLSPQSRREKAPEPKTAAAAVSADSAWGTAEQNGDAEFIDWLLLPEYRSVSDDGKVTDKAAILRHVRAASATVRENTSKVAEWKSTHPTKSAVSIVGDTAILNWVSTKPETAEAVSSCDIFVYRDGHWHGIYSQHTSISK